MRFIVSLVAVLTALGVGAFAFLSAERTIAVPALAIASPQVAPESRSVAAPSRHTPNSQFAQVGAAETPGASGAPTRVEQESQAAAPAGTNSSAPNAPAQNVTAPAASTIPQCDKPGGMGLARIVEIDTTGGPGFGFQHFKQYDFLHDKEVVLTFDDGPWPSTPAVLKALTDECLKATFFEIGEHATWHPEITKQVIDAGMTVGTHTWSHKDLARNPYAKHLEQAEQEVEMGNSAVHMAAAGGKIAPFFRFPELQHLPQLLSYLAERNIAIFSTDIDSRDFTMHKPDQVVKSVMSQLEKARQRHHPDARFASQHRRGAAGTNPPAQGGRLQGRAHGAEGRSRHRSQIRRNARARGQAVVQQYAAGEQRHPHHRRVALCRAWCVESTSAVLVISTLVVAHSNSICACSV